jgi:hypothetical protein
MRDKKVYWLTTQGDCTVIRQDNLVTIVKDKHGNIGTIDNWGKVTWEVKSEK